MRNGLRINFVPWVSYCCRPAFEKLCAPGVAKCTRWPFAVQKSLLYESIVAAYHRARLMRALSEVNATPVAARGRHNLFRCRKNVAARALAAPAVPAPKQSTCALTAEQFVLDAAPPQADTAFVRRGRVKEGLWLPWETRLLQAKPLTPPERFELLVTLLAARNEVAAYRRERICLSRVTSQVRMQDASMACAVSIEFTLHLIIAAARYRRKVSMRTLRPLRRGRRSEPHSSAAH